jgi:hypothetical protein
MNPATVHALPNNPIETLTTRFGQTANDAKQQTERLATTLRELDHLADQLTEHHLTVSVDLGPIGNAAAAARRDLEKRKDAPAFKLPRPA